MRIPKISEGLLALRLLGPRLLVRKLACLLYSKTRFLVFVKFVEGKLIQMQIEVEGPL
jgi:hypothetical protein